MSRRFQIAYAPVAEETLKKVSDPAGFRSRMEQTLGRVPYGHGSQPMRGERDRRTATIRNVFVVCYVAQAALTVTTVRLIPPP
ncbi:hypothetical protein [Streptomyces lichenis]|uniref:Type II toxin-antitoxin system RelE/ParE family toxin n=1 Tax=Streptomyces lichenis TaxID=2306967 RepID=A0ABT0IAT1_9ACTN|nr:hypothetical protein [Streptomyces lichenis]MCK8678431.1 hypothetical protein [Streptomyces lichenis]